MTTARMYRRVAIVALLLALSTGCSVPTLEAPECTAAKGVAKEFYSIHFAGDMRYSPENLEPRRKFLSRSAIAALPSVPGDSDVFTTGDTDYPKAFRIGGCRLAGQNAAEVEVLLFWKTDTRSEQRAIRVTAVRDGDVWLLDRFDLR